jgi:hypothetical protein
MAIATQYIDFNYKLFFQDFQLIQVGVTKETFQGHYEQYNN